MTDTDLGLGASATPRGATDAEARQARVDHERCSALGDGSFRNGAVSYAEELLHNGEIPKLVAGRLAVAYLLFEVHTLVRGESVGLARTRGRGWTWVAQSRLADSRARVSASRTRTADTRPPRPDIDFDADTLPEELRKLIQFVLWEPVWDAKATPPRWKKRPRQARNPTRGASTTDPATWAPFDVAAKAARRHGCGLGFVFTPSDPFCGIDLDDCIKARTVAPWAEKLIAEAASYTETTPGRRGVHLIVRAMLPGKGVNRYLTIGGVRVRMEIYDRARFFTVTGARLKGSPTKIADAQEIVKRLYRQLNRAAKEKRTAPTNGSGAGNGHDLSDGELLERALNAKNGDKLRRLLAGDDLHYKSRSEADAATAFMLAFWTQDRERILRIILHSRRGHDKWKRADYAERTISAALARVPEHYRRTEDGTRHGTSSGDEAEDDDASQGDPIEIMKRRPLAEMITNQPEPVIDGLAIRRNVTLLSSGGGVGKTSALLTAAIDAALGRPVWGCADLVPRAHRLLYLNAEDPLPNIDYWLAKILPHYGLDECPVDIFPVCETTSGAFLLSPDNATRLAEHVNDARYDCLIIDTGIALLTPGTNFVDPLAIRSFLRQSLGILQRQTRAAIVVAVHDNKRGDPVSGTADWTNFARLALHLKYAGETNGQTTLILETIKSNLGWPFRSVTLARDIHTLTSRVIDVHRVGEHREKRGPAEIAKLLAQLVRTALLIRPDGERTKTWTEARLHALAHEAHSIPRKAVRDFIDTHCLFEERQLGRTTAKILVGLREVDDD
jgi:hypothetical protein